MGLRSAVRSIFEVAPSSVTESVALEPPGAPERQGYEYGVPVGGTSGVGEQSQTQTRLEHLEELHDLYVGCAPVSVAVNAIAKSVTAGGIVLRPDQENPDEPEAVEPPELLPLKRLLKFTNPRENIMQVVRGVCTDLYVFGDAFLEVGWDGEIPAALWSLDAPSMSVVADEHGQVLGYKQMVPGRKEPVLFQPHEIIHFSIDNPRGGLYGLAPLELVQRPAAIWLFTAACLKETMRRGNPPRIHVDHVKDQRSAVQRWDEQYQVRNLGPKNIGKPINTTGGGHVAELSQNKVVEYLDTLRDMRDIVTGTLGAPPNKVNIVESGNLGGGTGEAQDKNWRTESVIPLQTLILEALNFQIVQQGFGISDWHLEFVEVDYRDSQVVENIRVQRLIHGAWTFNRYRRDIGEPPVEGGDDPMILDRGKFVYIKDFAEYTQAEMQQMQAPYIVATGQGAAPQPNADPNAAKLPEPPAESAKREFESRYSAVIEELSRGSNGHRAGSRS